MNFNDIIYEVKKKLYGYFNLEPPLLPIGRIKMTFEQISETEVLARRYDKKTNKEIYTPYKITVLSRRGEERLEKLLKERMEKNIIIL